MTKYSEELGQLEHHEAEYCPALPRLAAAAPHCPVPTAHSPGVSQPWARWPHMLMESAEMLRLRGWGASQN